MQPTSNAQQIAYWNEEGGERWVAIQARTDAAFAEVTQAALHSAAPQPGETVLDIGCGCGGTVLDLARSVAPAGNVVGLDVSRPMLALAEDRARGVGIANAEFILADASTYPFETRFDLAFSRFGVMFFDEPFGAFANIKRALRPGGRLAFLAWRPLKENPWFTVPLGVALQHVPPPAPADPRAPGPFAFADPQYVRDILERAGFSAIEIERRDPAMKLAAPGDLAGAASLATNLGVVSRLLTGQDTAMWSAVENGIREALKPYDGPAGVSLGGSVWFVTARA